MPRKLGELAESGAATCGPMAVADYFRLRDRFDLLGDFGIACEGPAHSVLLFSRQEIGQMDGGRIGLTNESSTSVRLLDLILRRKYGVEGLKLERGARDGDAGRLLIGDGALRAVGEGDPEYPFVYDLGEEWTGWQALPFVFARWVVSREVPEEDRGRIAATIGRSLDTWTERLDDITARRGAELDLDAEEIRDYLGTFRYRIGPVEGFGEQTFEGMLRDEDLIGGGFGADAGAPE